MRRASHFHYIHNYIHRLIKRSISISLEQEALKSLIALASAEQRPIANLAAEMLEDALSHRRKSEVYLERWQSLSPRERQVAALICLNYTNAETARQLTISPETVKSHTRSILSKMGMHNKAALRQCLADWDFREWLEKSISKLPHPRISRES